MRRMRIILAAAFLVVLATSASSFAAGADTYHGTLTGGAFYCDGTPAPGFAVTGTWNLNIDPATPAQVTLNVFYDGGHHLAYGYNQLVLESQVDGVYVFSGFGGIATATLDTTTDPTTFAWHVELGGGCPPEHPYNSLTYLGESRD